MNSNAQQKENAANQRWCHERSLYICSGRVEFKCGTDARYPGIDEMNRVAVINDATLKNVHMQAAHIMAANHPYSFHRCVLAARHLMKQNALAQMARKATKICRMRRQDVHSRNNNEHKVVAS